MDLVRDLSDRHHVLHPLVVSRLMSRNPYPGMLFPKLRHLDIFLLDFIDQAFYPRLVVGPMLRTVKIRVEAEDFRSDEVGGHPWDNFAVVMKTIFPDITTFCIESVLQGEGLEYLGMPPDIATLYCDFQNLESLDTPCIVVTSNTLSCLAILPRLRSLNISMDASQISTFSSTRPAPVEFPSLVALCIDTNNLAVCSGLFRRPRLQHLLSLTVVQTNRVGVSHCYWNLDSFFHAVQTNLPDLEKLVIKKVNDPRILPSDQTVAHITRETLTPLLSLANMSVLVIEIDVTVDLDDATIGRVAVAWPNLRVLRLFEITMGNIPKVTLGGLLPLAAACPRLEQLTLRVDATRIPSFAQTGNIVSANNLYRFDVCTSPVTAESHGRLASFISLIFPSLFSFKYGWFYATGWAGDDRYLPPMEILYAGCWEQVGTVLDSFLFTHPSPRDTVRWDYT